MNINKIKSYLKKFWHFVSHHNAVVVALELAIFAGVIFTLASENEIDGNLVEINGTSSQQIQSISTDFARTNEQISASVQENSTTTLEVFPPAASPNNQEIQQKYNQAAIIKAKYQLNGTSLKRTVNDNPKDKIVVEVGDKDKAEFVPEIKLSRWDEVNFKIIPNLEETAVGNKNLTFENDKIKFFTPKMSFEMYEFTEDEGRYKYIWYLNEKPTTNKVEFQIESLGLDFFYQPPLTEEYQSGHSEEFGKEIIVSETQVKDLEGNVLVGRPENVVGSYAVYHSTKGGMNDINGKDYKTGKAFHIFRPHLIDAEGKEAWGILHIENGIYSVEIPQEFLDIAVYPIRSNDDFGYYTDSPVGGTQFLSGGRLYGSIFNLSQAGTVTKLSARLSRAFGCSYYGVIYDSDKVKVDESDILAFAGAHSGWHDFTGVSGSLSAGDYWLVVQGQWSSAVIYFDTGDTNQGMYQNGTFGVIPNPLVPAAYNNNKYTIYATYTPSGGGAPTWQPRPGLISPSGGGFLMF